MDSLFAYLDYLRDNPPIGGLYKQYLEAKYSNQKSKPKYTNRQSKQTSSKEQAIAEKNALHSLCADFHMDINSLQKKPKRKLRKV